MLSVSSLLPLFTFAFVTSITPGPNNVMLMSSGMNFGFKRSLPHIAGVIIGFPVMLLLVGLGLMQVFERIPYSFLTLQIVSLSFILYLAWRIATTKTVNTDLQATLQATQPMGFLQIALFQWVNPKAWVMALTTLSVYTPATRPLSSVLLIALIFFMCAAITSCVWTLLGFQLKRLLSDPRKLRATNIVLALLLVLTLLPILMSVG